MAVPKVWAIDLGHSAIKGVLLAAENDGVEVLDAGVLPLPPQAGKAPEEPSRDERVWKGLAEFERRHQISANPVAAAIPPANTLTREIEITIVGKRSVEEIVRYEALSTIPYVLNEVFWDYHIFDHATRQGGHLKGLLFAAKKTTIQTYLHAFAQAGVEKVIDMVLAPMGILSFMQFEKSPGGACLGIDIGAENCSMVGLSEDEFWLRDFEAGGNVITKILMDKFDMGFPQAEQAKKKIADSPKAQELIKIIKPGIHGIMKGLETNREYIERTGSNTHFENVFLFGGGRRLPGITKNIKQLTARKPAPIKGFEKISVSQRADRRWVLTNSDRLAVALGAGIKALGKTPFDFSFIPRTSARSVRASENKKFAIAGALVVLLAMSLLMIFYHSASARLREGIASAQSANLSYAEQRRSLDLAGELDAMEKELEWFLSLPAGRGQAAEIAAEITAIFARANEQSTAGNRFTLESLHVRRHEGDEESGTLPELTTHIRGQVRGREEREAYQELNTEIIDKIRESSVLKWFGGTALFAENSTKVENDNAGWEDYLRSDDEVLVLEEDNGWYSIEEVVDDTELQLSREYGGEDSQRWFLVSRADLESWDYRERTFRIQLSTFARGMAAHSQR